MTAKSRPWWQEYKQPLVTLGVVIIVLLIICPLLVYIFGWDWTGFKGKTLWDWLGLLAVFAIPVVVGFGVALFAETQRQAERDQEERTERKTLLRELRKNIIQAYNEAKGVRRILRGAARCYLPNQNETIITREPYDKQMQALISTQLQFETLKVEVDSLSTLFSGKIDLTILLSNLVYIEKYLNDIIGEYEDLYKNYPYDAPTIPISKLPKLGEFIGKYKNAIDFQEKFQEPAHQLIRLDLRNLLNSE